MIPAETTPPAPSGRPSTVESPHASPHRSREPVPIVFIEGFMGMSSSFYWGPLHKFNRDDEPEKGPRRRKRRKLIFLHIGALSSLHDRACEVYYQLKGGRVNYGEKHSRATGHEQYGREHKGFYPQWSSENPLHFVSHSFGAPTVWYLQQLLMRGFFAYSFDPIPLALSPLASTETFAKIEKSSTNSITAYDGPTTGFTTSPTSIEDIDGAADRQVTSLKEDHPSRRQSRSKARTNDLKRRGDANHADWVRSTTSIQATYRGSSLTYIVGQCEDSPGIIRPFSAGTFLARFLQLYLYLDLSESITSRLYDFNLDHWKIASSRSRNASKANELRLPRNVSPDDAEARGATRRIRRRSSGYRQQQQQHKFEKSPLTSPHQLSPHQRRRGSGATRSRKNSTYSRPSSPSVPSGSSFSTPRTGSPPSGATSQGATSRRRRRRRSSFLLPRETRSLLFGLKHMAFTQSRDNALYDMSVRRMEKLNRKALVCGKTFYRSFTTSMTEANPINKTQTPVLKRQSLLNPLTYVSWLMGRHKLRKPENIWGSNDNAPPPSPSGWENTDEEDESRWVDDGDDAEEVRPATVPSAWTTLAGTAYTSLSWAFGSSLTMLSVMKEGFAKGPVSENADNRRDDHDVRYAPSSIFAPAIARSIDELGEDDEEDLWRDYRPRKSSTSTKIEPSSISSPPLSPRRPSTRRERTKAKKATSSAPGTGVSTVKEATETLRSLRIETALSYPTMADGETAGDENPIATTPPSAGPWTPTVWQENDGMCSTVSQRHPGSCRVGYCVGCPTTKPSSAEETVSISTSISNLCRSSNDIFFDADDGEGSHGSYNHDETINADARASTAAAAGSAALKPGVWYTSHLPHLSHASLVPHFPSLFRYGVVISLVQSQIRTSQEFLQGLRREGIAKSFFTLGRTLLGRSATTISSTLADGNITEKIIDNVPETPYDRLMEDIFSWIHRVDETCIDAARRTPKRGIEVSSDRRHLSGGLTDGSYQTIHGVDGARGDDGTIAVANTAIRFPATKDHPVDEVEIGSGVARKGSIGSDGRRRRRASSFGGASGPTPAPPANGGEWRRRRRGSLFGI